MSARVTPGTVTSARVGRKGDRKCSTVPKSSASATGTKLGQNIGITIIIYDYSTAADRQQLVDAFTKGENQGLVNALSKMPAVGRIAITGTPVYDLSSIRHFQMKLVLLALKKTYRLSSPTPPRRAIRS
jgi:hypothetical protein